MLSPWTLPRPMPPDHQSPFSPARSSPSLRLIPAKVPAYHFSSRIVSTQPWLLACCHMCTYPGRQLHETPANRPKYATHAIMIVPFSHWIDACRAGRRLDHIRLSHRGLRTESGTRISLAAAGLHSACLGHRGRERTSRQMGVGTDCRSQIPCCDAVGLHSWTVL